MTAPVLATARLVLRGHTPDDFGDCAAMWADPLVTRHIGGKPFDGEEVWARLLRYIGHWTALGFGYWSIRDKVSGDFIGEAGFADFHRAISPSFGDAPEIGWAFATAAHGQGFATEVVTALTAWSDQHLDAGRTVCMINPENAASRRVAEKCGFREFAPANYHGAPTHLFERPRSGQNLI
jgi:RimJ/RimL family protein N-acetyltransferase